MQKYSWSEAKEAFGPLKVGTFKNSSNEQFSAAYYTDGNDFTFIHYSEKAKAAGINSPETLKGHKDETCLYIITDEAGNDVLVAGLIGANSHEDDEELW